VPVLREELHRIRQEFAAPEENARAPRGGRVRRPRGQGAAGVPRRAAR
jgi:hypothetical protein